MSVVKDLYVKSELFPGNLKITGNTFSSTDTNGDINIIPDGTGEVLLKADPVSLLGSATKQYVDSKVTGLVVMDSVRVKTAGALDTYTQAGTKVGATLTATANGSINGSGIDGLTNLATSERVLVDGLGTTTDVDNGIYTITQLGSAGTPWILTRATDADINTELTNSSFVLVEEGVEYTGSGWTVSTPITVDVDVTVIPWTQFSQGSTPTSVANVGTGAGEIYRDTTTNIINLKTVASGSTKLSVTNNADDISLDVVQSNITGTGALNSGSITPGFGSIDIGASPITTTGTVTAGALDLGTGTISAGTLAINDTASAFDLNLISTSNAVLTADRTITFDTNNSDILLDLDGDILLSNTFITSGGFSTTLTGTGTTDVTLPTTGTLTTLSGTETFTNKTITSPIINQITTDGTEEVLIFADSGAAVNEFTITNATTSSNPELSSTGDDANVGMDFLSKGTGVFNFSAGSASSAGEIRLFDDTEGGYVGLGSTGTVTSSYTIDFPPAQGANTSVLVNDGSGNLSWELRVVGPGGGATDNAVVRWDTTTGLLLQDSGVLIDDSDNLTGVVDITASGDLKVDDIDTNTATTLLIGKSTATKIEIGDSGVTTEVKGPFDVLDVFTNTAAVTGYISTIHNTDTGGGGDGLIVRAGDAVADITMRLADQPNTMTIMEAESKGCVVFGKTFDQTVIDNTTVWGIDNQHTTTPKADFNTENGGYRIAGNLLVLNDLDDVTITSPGQFEQLGYNGSRWVNEKALFGRDYGFAEDNVGGSTTSVAYIQVVRLTTASLNAGTYKISWTIDVRTSKNQQAIFAQVELDDTTQLQEHGPIHIEDTGDYRTAGSFRDLVLTSGVHTIDLDFRIEGGGGQVGSYRNARIEFFRLD